MKKSLAAFAALAMAGGLALVTAAPANATETTLPEGVCAITYDLQVEEFVPGTPHEGYLEVDGNWAEATISTGWTGKLSELEGLDIVADPIQYVGLHIQTAVGNLTYEEEPSYAGNLWSKTAWAGVGTGMGYEAYGKIADFVAAGHGDVAVTDVVLLYTHPNASFTTVESITIGGETLTFAPATEDDYVWTTIESGEGVALPDGLTDGEVFEGEDGELYRYVVTGEVECAVVPPATPAKVTPTSSTLAKTGFDGGPLLISSALGLLVAGGALAFVAARRRVNAE